MILEKVTEKTLHPAELEISDLHSALADLHHSDLDFGDIYIQHAMAESWMIDESKVKNGSFNIMQGLGVRAVSGEKCSLAFSHEISANAIKQSVKSARSISRIGQEASVPVLTEVKGNSFYEPINPFETMDRDLKIKLLQDMDKYARDSCPLVRQFNARISGSFRHVLVASTDGTLGADIRPLISLRCGVVVEKDGRRESGGAGGGTRGCFDFFFEPVGNTTRAMSYVDDAIRQALVKLESVEAPAGPMTVVLASGKSGVLIHEAVGHGLEGDSCRKNTSLFSKLMGQKVSSPVCTVVDDGTIPNSPGSLNIDDEGNRARRNVLIENGVVTSFMYDRHNASLVGKQSTGNGRRMSHSTIPITRMTNTYMMPGESEPEEIISSVKHGVYAVDFAGGQVDTTSGQFIFEADEAYMIENGKVTVPIKGATLIGNAIEVMNNISMVGNDLAFDPGLGSCGKRGQLVRVGIGIPTLKIDSITVGGTKS